MAHRIQALGSLTIATVILCGSIGPRPANAAPTRPSGKKPAPKSAAVPGGSSLNALPLIKRLKQLDNGPGVLVCEPVPAPGTEAAAVNFGAGCSRWLHLMVAGHGELGKTPLWDAGGHALKELKRPNFRLTQAEAKRLPSILGVTHAVLGKVKGSLKQCTLSFEVVDLAKGTRVGPAIAVTGTSQELSKRLPVLARSITSALGVKSPRVPSAVGENAAELQRLGACPWLPSQQLDANNAAFLRRLGGEVNDQSSRGRPARPYLAGFLSFLYAASVKDVPSIKRLGGSLARQLPENTLLLGELGRQAFRAGGGPVDEVQGAAPSALRRFPNSYHLRIGSTYELRMRHQLKRARGEAEAAVRCASRNPDAWLAFSGTVSSMAQEIRESRYASQMSKQEMDACQQLYEDELIAGLQAVSLDQQYATAWTTLCQSAAFAGATDLADQAFDRALALDPTNAHTLDWGLELYQPKWQNNPAKLRKVGLAVVNGSTHFSSEERVEMAVKLRHAALPDLSARVVRSEEERGRVNAHFKRR